LAFLALTSVALTSSGLWPFAVNGWPQDSHKTQTSEGSVHNDLARFYPTSVLVTGYDILFFWVARMAMLGLELTDKEPFHAVYLHGLVRDQDGQKMSKTKGNVIDPLEAVSRYGCDALRHSLLLSVSPLGLDLPMSLDKLDMSRNFVNKLWNIGKFVGFRLSSENFVGSTAISMAIIDDTDKLMDSLQSYPVIEQYIIRKCLDTVRQVTASLEQYRFAEAGTVVEEFIWNDFASWYLEITKTRVDSSSSPSSSSTKRANQANMALAIVWERCLRMLHPFVPYVTEAMWLNLKASFPEDSVFSSLNSKEQTSIMLSPWPKVPSSDILDQTTSGVFDAYKDIVIAVRNIRAEYKAEPGKKIPVAIQLQVSDAECDASRDLYRLLCSETKSLSLLAGLDESQLSITIIPNGTKVWENQNNAWNKEQIAHGVVSHNVHVFAPVSGLIDVQQELTRLRKVAEGLEKEIAGLRSRVDNEGFLKRAKPEVIQETQNALQQRTETLNTVLSSISSLSKN
jgi:valyl-tRNA synthetase